MVKIENPNGTITITSDVFTNLAGDAGVLRASQIQNGDHASSHSVSSVHPNCVSVKKVYHIGRGL